MIQPHTLLQSTKALGPALGLGWVLLLASCATSGQAMDVAELVRLERFDEALKLANERLDDQPESAERQAEQAHARVGKLLSEARTSAYAGNDSQALELLEEAQRLLPGHPVVQDWIRKTRGDLAREAGRVAFELEGSGDLEEAAEAYRDVLRFAPENELAKSGVDRVNALIEYRATLAEDYYADGIRSLREFHTAEAVRDFQASLKYAPDAEDSISRQGEVQRILGQERLRIAEELYDRGLYHAAANEFRVAELYDPGLEEALAGRELALLESGVLDDLQQVDRLMRRGEFEQTFEILEAAAARTTEQAEVVAAARDGAEEARIEALYNDALELQADYKLPEAVLAFDRLLEATGGFYADAIARRDSLIDFMAEAEQLYAEYEGSSDDSERLRYLRQINLIWPTYKNVESQLSALENRLGKSSRMR